MIKKLNRKKYQKRINTKKEKKKKKKKKEKKEECSVKNESFRDHHNFDKWSVLMHVTAYQFNVYV